MRQTSVRRVILLVVIVVAALFVAALLLYGWNIARETIDITGVT